MEVLGEKLLLVKITVFVDISLLNKLENIIIADDDIEILVKDLLDFGKSDKPFLFSIKQCEHVHGLVFPSSSLKPFLLDHL